MRLRPATAQALSTMHSLEILDLSGNPLGLLPDLSQLHALEVLDLSRTGSVHSPAACSTCRNWKPPCL
ncbi:hypothetical protein QNM99_18420 [Pseudomonas sp. PCH446]